ncbi:hypothetical protein FGKAn22_03190 [Ferrigenium kumadai]|uniref:Uncharacterized protein n=1 Tax=Ferrigenium kumadai TaxID=1682490 RepID=A0AAN1SXX7_9PROT|nr:hypothetical protein [Ferrigenium kumadai]BBI98626.1 hypothetical protein FGKAn22_03190 [Ferrigenium kumadai]
MINPFELDKQRDIVFSDGHPEQLEQAYLLLSGLPNCKVAYGDGPHTLQVSYNLRDYTLEGLENALIEEGFHLDHSLLHSIGRKVIYYCEDTTCHNMEIPVHPTKKNEREVFMKAYDQQPHGDHDDIPPELREYK